MSRTAIFMCAAAIGSLMAMSAATAQDDVLRGSFFVPGTPKTVNWAGVYAGGQVGHIESKANMDENVSSVVANMLRVTRLESEAGVSSWATVGERDARASSYGFFVGYNTQWDNDLVLGFEANYNRTSLSISGSGDLHRIVTLSDQFQYDVSVLGQSRIDILDYGSIRARAGYVWQNLLPYATLGFAMGRANTLTSATVSYPQPVYAGTPPGPPAPPAVSLTDTQSKSNQFIYGYAAGLGFDWLITPNIFVRGEYEYLKFTNIDTSINNIRAGAGLKF